MMERVVAKDILSLYSIVSEHLAAHGDDSDLNHIDVSGIESMERLFAGSGFCGDISKWDVSRLSRSAEMFKDSAFAGDVSGWSLSALAVRNARAMFLSPHFASRLPKILDVGFGTTGCLVHQDFMGGFHPDNSLGDAARLFGSGALLNRYLHRSAELGAIGHLHMEKAYMARRAPSDFPQDLYEWVCSHKPLLMGLGLTPHEAGAQLMVLHKERGVSWELAALPVDFEAANGLE